MVNDVMVNDVMEEMTANKAEITVNGGEGALDKGPAVGFEVGDIRVGVVQVGDGDCFSVSFADLTSREGRRKTYRASGEPTCTG